MTALLLFMRLPLCLSAAGVAPPDTRPLAPTGKAGVGGGAGGRGAGGGAKYRADSPGRRSPKLRSSKVCEMDARLGSGTGVAWGSACRL
jgi:hypothetical protein